MNTSDEDLNHNRGDLYPIWLEESTRGLFDIAPVAVRRAVLESKDPSLFSQDTKELESEITPTRTDKKIKLSFWKEYDRASRDHCPMKTENICKNVCHPNYFRDHFLKREKKVAWLFIPPTDYLLELESMMSIAADRINEIINIPIERTNKNGDQVIDIKAAELVLKAIKQLEDRVKGAPTQRLDQRSLQVSVDGNKQLSHEVDIDKKILELEEKLKNTRIQHIVEDAEIVEE